MHPDGNAKGYFSLRIINPDGSTTQPPLSFNKIYLDPYTVIFDSSEEYRLKLLLNMIRKAKPDFREISLNELVKNPSEAAADTTDTANASPIAPRGEGAQPIGEPQDPGRMLSIFTGKDLQKFTLWQNAIAHGKEMKPLRGIQARIETGSELQSRVTVTRLVLLGVLAFALPKKSGGEKYLTIDGPDFMWAEEFDGTKPYEMKMAMEFVTNVNSAARVYAETHKDAAPDQTSSSTPSATALNAAKEFTDNLVRLSELHKEGSLTDAEFAAAKAKLLGMC